MFGLAIKDFLVMRKSVTYYLGFMAVYGFLAACGVLPYSILAGMVPLVGLMLPMSSFAYDDQAKWERFAVATPAGRRGVAQGKYLFALLGTLVSSVLAGVILTAMGLLGTMETETWWEPLAVVGSCACATLLMDSALLPFLLKYGAEKARILSLLVFAVVFGGMALLGFLAERGFTLPEIPPIAVTLFPALLVVVTVAALAASYGVSLGIYRNKEL